MSVEGITEADIANYLANTPGFFERQAELLGAIQLTSPHGSRAVSLQERQMEMLRDKIRGLEGKIIEMIRNSQENVTIADKLHRWTRVLFLTLDDIRLPGVLVDELKEQFLIPQGAIRIWGAAESFAGEHFATPVTDDLKSFAAGLTHALLRPQRRFRGGLVVQRCRQCHLAGDDSRCTAAAAIGPTFGMLVLGSPDPDTLCGRHGDRLPATHRRNRQRCAGEAVARCMSDAAGAGPGAVPAPLALAREPLGDELSRHLVHLRVERRLAERTLAMYGEALVRCSDLPRHQKSICSMSRRIMCGAGRRNCIGSVWHRAALPSPCRHGAAITAGWVAMA